MANKRLRDLVILLPGITGSVLRKDNKDLWAISGQAAWRALRNLGDSLQELQLEEDDPFADDIGDGVTADRVMPDVHIVPGLVRIDGYSSTIRMITDNFQVVRGSLLEARPTNFLEFPYDWRRDNRATARHLQKIIERQLPMWREHSGAKDARVILIAHSMGGLVSRYYLEVLEGWRHCKALVSFGTPYRGSLNVLNFLANGYRKLFVDLTEVMRSFPSVYQLLPIYKALRVGGLYTRVAATEGIKGVDSAQATDALRFHREIEQAVIRHRQDTEYLEQGYKIIPIVGTRQPTFQSATFENGAVKLNRELPAGIDELLSDGDGAVPRVSAIPIEMSDEYRDTFVPERHGSLQRNRHVLSDILGRLEQMQSTGLRDIRGPEINMNAGARSALALDLDDLYLADEPVELRVQLVNAAQEFSRLRFRLDPLPGTRGDQREGEFEEAEKGWVVRLEDLPPGLYRATVSSTMGGRTAPPPVHDVFEVAGD